ncbi:MAG: hypothetical protein ACXACI_16230 [Candidatus Hodarchaeales archaeon]|jgi:Lhr-like helicase
MSFSQLNSQIQKVLAERFQEPTAIPRLSFPTVGAGENCLLIAPTGSGKTFTLLIFDASGNWAEDSVWVI